MKPAEMEARLIERGWKSHPSRPASADGKAKAILWTRDTMGSAPQANDTLVTYEIDGEAAVFRASRHELQLILSGKAPPA